MTDVLWLWLIPGLPLLGSAICGALHLAVLRARRAAGARGGAGEPAHGAHGADPGLGAHGADPAHGAHGAGPGLGALAPWVASLAVAGAFAASIVAFARLAGGADALASTTWSWIHAGTMDVDVRLVVDRLSSVMILVVTGVGLLIHVYSAGYMKGDAGYAKYFAYLNLFVFAMLLLVLSSNLLGLFIGWEGVGLCSYLLIGFWYQKGWPAEAGQKAFVVNRIGDACFLVGSFLLVRLFGTLDMAAIVESTRELVADPDRAGTLALAGLLLFGGAVGKSAQLPLFVWLPDAMAGPTPVSALIHAATMVTAGIYLVVRLNPVFAASPELLLLVATIGAATAFIAGSTALVQRDIKRVLAYSTVSQLGYMALALGTGAFAAAIFHLVTHAFFKALLFLGAGSVIHGMREEQDMHRMGGLKRHMPATYATFLAGAAALSGLPLLSGFFSKDEILAHAFAAGGAYSLLWGVGVFTAAMTAFYTWRMVALTFHGTERFDVEHVHPHESPPLMTVPLWILAVLSVTGGLLGLPHVLHAPHLLGDWLAPVLAPGRELLGEAHHLSAVAEWILLAVGAGVALFFAHHGFHSYAKGVAADEELARERPGLAGFLGRAWGLDAAFKRLVVEPVTALAFVIAVVVDQFAIDGLVNGTARGARELGLRLRRMADGRIPTYGLWMGASAAVIALIWTLGGAR